MSTMKPVLVLITSFHEYDKQYPLDYVKERTDLIVVEKTGLAVVEIVDIFDVCDDSEKYHPSLIRIFKSGRVLMLVTGESWNNHNEPLRGCFIDDKRGNNYISYYKIKEIDRIIEWIKCKISDNDFPILSDKDNMCENDLHISLDDFISSHKKLKDDNESLKQEVKRLKEKNEQIQEEKEQLMLHPDSEFVKLLAAKYAEDIGTSTDNNQ